VISGTLGGRRITAPAPSGEVRLFSVLFSSPSPNVRQNPNNSQNNNCLMIEYSATPASGGVIEDQFKIRQNATPGAPVTKII
jgi:hypothetical protein